MRFSSTWRTSAGSAWTSGIGPIRHVTVGAAVVGDLRGERRDVDAAQLQRGVVRGAVEEVVDEVLHPARARADPVDVAAQQVAVQLTVVQLAGHHLRPALDPRQRVAEVVGDDPGERRQVDAPGVLDRRVTEDQQGSGAAGDRVAGQR